MSRWRSIWLVAKREILERGRSRGFILSVLFTTAARGRFVRRPDRCCSATRTPTTIGVVAAGAAGSRGCAVTATADQFDQRSTVVPLRRRGCGRGRARRRAPSTPSSSVPADLSAAGTIRFAKEPDQAIAQIVVGGRRRAARPERPGRGRRRSGCARRGAAAAGGRSARPADRGRPGAVPVREHRRRPDPRRHLQLRLHGADRRRRGEAEPRRRGRPRRRSAPRDLLMGKVLGIGVLGLVQLVVFVDRRARRRVLTEPVRRCPRPRPAAIVLLAVWFVLGYALYSTALGLPRRARIADGGGLERVDAGDDGRDDQLLRGDLRGHQRPVRRRSPRSRRSSRPRRRSSCRCGPRSTPSRRSRSRSRSPSRSPRSGSCSRSGRASTPAPCSRRPGGSKLRDAWRSAGQSRSPPGAGAVGARSSGSNSAGVPPACQNTTRCAVQRPRADAGDEAGQRLRRVDRVDEDPLGPGEQQRGLLGGLRRAAVARRRAGTRRGRSARVDDRRVADAPGRRASPRSTVGARPPVARRRRRSPSCRPRRPQPTSRPACVPPVADGRTIRSMPKPAASACASTSARGEHLAVGAERAGPPDADHVRAAAAGRSVVRRPARPSPRVRRGPPSAADGPSRRTPRQPDARTGRVDRRAGEDDVDREAGPRPGGSRQPRMVRPAPTAR